MRLPFFCNAAKVSSEPSLQVFCIAANVSFLFPQKVVIRTEIDIRRQILSKNELGHLAVAKKLADDSGRHLSQCMEEAAEIIIRKQREPRLPKVRALYIALACACSVLVLNSIFDILNAGSVLSPLVSIFLLVFVLANFFWITPEVPLMSKLWTRWNTPAFIAMTVFVLFSNHPLVSLVYDLALVLFFGVAILATVHGSRYPDQALENRLYTTKFLFHKLSANDQGRIFFLAPWLSPFGFRANKRR